MWEVYCVTVVKSCIVEEAGESFAQRTVEAGCVHYPLVASEQKVQVK